MLGEAWEPTVCLCELGVCISVCVHTRVLWCFTSIRDLKAEKQSLVLYSGRFSQRIKHKIKASEQKRMTNTQAKAQPKTLISWVDADGARINTDRAKWIRDNLQVLHALLEEGRMCEQLQVWTQGGWGRVWTTTTNTQLHNGRYTGLDAPLTVIGDGAGDGISWDLDLDLELFLPPLYAHVFVAFKKVSCFSSLIVYLAK